MNHIYRVIFNQETGTFQAVSEIVKTSRKSHSSKGGHLPKILLTPLSVAVTLLSSQAFASPTGGQVTAGVANIAQTGTITNINQSSQNAAINWQSFSVGKNETVNFNQPNAQSVTLNRVIGNERSVIDGAMNANGKVFISNANGMLIGKDAKINVGSLVATTANISDDDLMNGRYSFTGEGAGSIENLGHISVPKGGVVALVAPIVKNGGTITAPQANVLLASAESFSITLPDNANFSYTLDKGTLQGLVDNGGAILADAGRVVLTAQGIDTVKKSLIKHTGAIQANTVSNKNGVIELLGDLDNSALTVSGSLKAEAKESGDGGFIETSASQVKIEDSTEVSTLAENGKTGTWLIDPKDFTIKAGKGAKTENSIGADTLATNLKNNNVVIQTVATGSEKGNINVNAPVSWSKNRLTLSAHNDIHINANMNGSGTAKLALEYGQGSADGGESDYHIKRGAKVNLPMGNTLTTKKGKDGEKIDFTVIHQMPDIIKNKDGDWESQFNIRNIAFGKDIDLGYTKDHEGFAGWKLQSGHPYNISDTETRWARIAGLGHTINNLNLHSKKNSTKTGLFQDNVVGTQDEYIRDIGLINANVKSEGNDSEAGGLFGYGGNIHNSYVIGDITTTGNDSFAGGLMGRGIGIYNSYSQGNVTTHGQNSQVGGLVGWGWNIYGSHSASNVSSTGDYSNAGGLMGYGGLINNSYVTGKVVTEGKDANAGGLVGYGHDINNSYSNNISILAKSKDSIAGGLVGVYHGQDESKNSFFNKDKQPKLSAIGKIDTTYNPNSITNFTNLVGKTDSELKQKSTFTKAGWDFDTVWSIQDGKDYPRLRDLTESKGAGNPIQPNNPTKPVVTDSTNDKAHKERKHIFQINYEVVKKYINKKPEKPIELQKGKFVHNTNIRVYTHNELENMSKDELQKLLRSIINADDSHRLPNNVSNFYKSEYQNLNDDLKEKMQKALNDSMWNATDPDKRAEFIGKMIFSIADTAVNIYTVGVVSSQKTSKPVSLTEKTLRWLQTYSQNPIVRKAIIEQLYMLNDSEQEKIMNIINAKTNITAGLLPKEMGDYLSLFQKVTNYIYKNFQGSEMPDGFWLDTGALLADVTSVTISEIMPDSPITAFLQYASTLNDVRNNTNEFIAHQNEIYKQMTDIILLDHATKFDKLSKSQLIDSISFYYKKNDIDGYINQNIGLDKFVSESVYNQNKYENLPIFPNGETQYDYDRRTEYEKRLEMSEMFEKHLEHPKYR